MDRATVEPSSPLFVWVAAVVLVGGSLGACGALNQDAVDGDFTSVPTQPSSGSGTTTPSPVLSPNDGGATASPNAAMTTPTPTPAATGNGNAPASTPTLGVAEGFALRAGDYSGYCLASSDATPKVGSTVKLAPCENSAAQSFSFYKGGFALLRSLCLQSNGVGSGITLQTCNVGATQVWELNGVTRLMSHTITTSPVKGQTVAFASASATGQVVGQNAGGGSPLRLTITALPGASSFPIRARDGQNVDVCLADVAGSPSMLPCNLQDARQAWNFLGNQLQQVASQRCLFGDTSSKLVTVGACPSAPTTSQQWYLMDFFISLMAPSTTNATNSLVLVIDPTSRALSLSGSSGPDPTFAVGAAGPFP